MIGKTFSGLFTVLVYSHGLWAQVQPPNRSPSLGKSLALSTFQILVNHKSCILSLKQYLGCIASLQELVSSLDSSLSLTTSLASRETESNIEFSAKNLIIVRNILPPKTQAPKSQKDIYNQIKEKHKKFKEQYIPTYEVARQSTSLYIDDLTSFIALKFKTQITETHIVGAINSFISVAKDPHSHFWTKKEYHEMTTSFIGLGVTLSMGPAGLTIIDVVINSGAYDADLRGQDILVSVDGKSLKGLSMDEATELLKGEENSRANLEIIRNSTHLKKIVSWKKIGEKIVSFAPFSIFGKHFGYIKYKDFMYKDGCLEISNALHRFNKQNVSGVLLDLRNNRGGSTKNATCLSSLFLGPGKVISLFENGAGNQTTYSYSETNGFLVFEKPLVILINADSASASELLAGAMKEYNRALIVGQTSYGKGTAQNLLGDTELFLLFGTSGRFYHPSGKSNQMVGVTPHLEVFKNREPSENEVYALREKDLYLFPLEPNRIQPPLTSTRLDRLALSTDCVTTRDPLKAFNDAPEKSFLKDWQLLSGAASIGCYDQNLWQQTGNSP